MGDLAELLGGDFDTGLVEPSVPFEPIPAGWYPVLIDSAEIKDCAKVAGKQVRMGMTVLGDKFAGRKLWPNFLLVHPSDKAVEIGARDLSACAVACGLLRVSDTAEFVNKMLLVQVKVTKQEGRAPDNDITGYKPIDDGVTEQATAAQTSPARAAATAAVAAQAPAAAAAPAAQTAAPARPWMRK